MPSEREVMEATVESYKAQLARRLKTDPPKRKGERTRERFKLATARVLEKTGYHAMRVSDITKAAKSSDGSFYMYFKDKKDVALTVLREFLEGMQLVGASHAGRGHDPFESIRYANASWIHTVRVNAGLMRSVFQMSDEDGDFSRLVHSTNRAWYERVARSVVKNHPEGSVDPSAALFAVWALGSMMDEIMRRVVVYPDTDFVDFLEKAAPEADDLAMALSVIWYRVLYPDLDLPDGLGGLAKALTALDSRTAAPAVR
jgi:AcrR family transcriptional regulator